MLHRVDAEPVSVSEGYPVLKAAGEHVDNMVVHHVQIPQILEIGTFCLRIGVVYIALAKIPGSCPSVGIGVLQLERPDAIFASGYLCDLLVCFVQP